MKYLLLIFVALTVLTSCLKSTQQDPAPLPSSSLNDISYLAGQWDLVRYQTPDSVVTPKDLYSVNFDGTGTVKNYFNNNLTGTDTYTVAQGKSIYTTDRPYIITYGNSATPKRSALVVKKDSLLLADEILNGKSYFYIRHK
jgi:hypothetical protein